MMLGPRRGLPPPMPVATAMYCLPSTENELGGARMPELVGNCQSALPVVASAAMNDPEFSPKNTSPEAVERTPADAVAAGQRIARAARLDVGAVEYLETPDGRRVFYDINANSNLRPSVAAAFGFDPFERVSGAQASLLDSLRDQLEYLTLTPRQRVIADEVLGNLDQDGFLGASADEIKRAYRKAAAANHPDRNQGDAEAVERFKEAAEAYEVLSDQDKKAQYDRFGHAGVGGAAGGSQGFGGGMNMEDIFEQFGRK